MLRSARFVVSERIRSALASNRGVVALESTVITHGLPYPQNLETAKALENEVRKEGCEPATIALINGKIHVGLTDGQLQEVADTMDSVKVSRRDIAVTLNKEVIGGTTVAATMFLAHMAGIKVFATGGTGGVHRGADQTFDISADLLELARTPVTVVSAGVKSILDIPKTVEFLETHSVNTIVYGERNEFPGFFTRNSGCRGQFNTMDLKEVARVIETSQELGLKAGTVLACPIPEEFQANGKLIEDAIQEALSLARKKNITAQQVTPFILKTVNELTKGASMKTNIALLKNNAKIGAQLAKILAESGRSPVRAQRSFPGKDVPKKPKVTVIGATIVDLEAISQEDVKKDGGSYEGVTLQRCGGVGRNHADALTRLGCDTTLISAIGTDSHGKYFLDRCSHMDLSRVSRIETLPTATYWSICVRGDIWFGISSGINRIADEITPDLVSRNEDAIKNSEFLVLDGNIPVGTIGRAVELAQKYEVPVWFDPTDYHKACKVIDCGRLDGVKYASPNVNEFRMIAERLGVQVPEEACQSVESMEAFVGERKEIWRHFQLLLVSMADKGSVVFRSDGASSSPNSTRLPCHVLPNTVVSASGAGDCMNSGIISGLLRNLPWEQSLDLGLRAAACSLRSTEAVPDSLNDL